MARKNRNLADFNEVANANISKNASTNTNVNVNDDSNINDSDNVETNTVQMDSINANKEKNINIAANVDDINDLNINENDNKQEVKMDYLDKLIEGNTKKNENSSVLTGIYLQKDLSVILDRLAKKGGRGAKSKIVNEALRSVFMEKGLL
ncbi:hypothetical protein HPT25_27990 [Bacillus sp. BRMEA1]|uniref:hypothetical protein n=1 Tax=Neobacillus endophyticus TaxID=2738405 RepID=UPI00156435A6|nr:hypothetical protein [Neobacillus endophyticus]NRD81136.1 hypothetical protein [Neobacillus endophyticus]